MKDTFSLKSNDFRNDCYAKSSHTRSLMASDESERNGLVRKKKLKGTDFSLNAVLDFCSMCILSVLAL